MLLGIAKQCIALLSALFPSHDGVVMVSSAMSHQINQFSPYHRVDQTCLLRLSALTMRPITDCSMLKDISVNNFCENMIEEFQYPIGRSPFTQATGGT